MAHAGRQIWSQSRHAQVGSARQKEKVPYWALNLWVAFKGKQLTVALLGRTAGSEIGDEEMQEIKHKP